MEALYRDQSRTTKDGASLTRINFFLDVLAFDTLVPLCNRLRFQSWAIDITIRIHCSLQRISFPSKDVISMGTISGSRFISMNRSLSASCLRVSLTPYKRLLCGIFRPERFIVELCRIPNHLVEELRNLNRMGRWTRSTTFKGATTRVGDVAHVVFAVEVYSIPTSRIDQLPLCYLLDDTDVGKRRLAMIPAGHGFVGNAVVSPVRVLAF